MNPRSDTINLLAQHIVSLEIDHPTRVAVDGRTASGKTTFSAELAEAISRFERPAIRTSIDGFHNSRSVRHARGRYSWEGYYHDARNLDAIVASLLKPLGPDGDLYFRTETFDLERDVPVTQTPAIAAANAIVIVDGTFLMRPELRPHWDVVVFVSVSEAEAERRGIARDVKGDDEAATRQLYAERYRPAFSFYHSTCDPMSKADAIFVNEDVAHPRLEFVVGRVLARN
jgi:uridine kinase